MIDIEDLNNNNLIQPIVLSDIDIAIFFHLKFEFTSVFVRNLKYRIMMKCLSFAIKKRIMM